MENRIYIVLCVLVLGRILYTLVARHIKTRERSDIQRGLIYNAQT